VSSDYWTSGDTQTHTRVLERSTLHPSGISPLFENRYDAGRRLAARLAEYKGKDTVVLAIPNGGLPVGAVLARDLEAELDLVVVRKLPFPLYPEAGFGAVADDGSVILDDELVRRENLTPEQVNNQVSLVTGQVRQRSLLYRKDRPLAMVRGKIAIVTDDGLASGYTMLAAVASVRRRRAKEVVVAIPAASALALKKVSQVTDRVLSLAESNGPHFTLADYYRHWHDVPDNEVIKLLEDTETRRPRTGFTAPR
jgi:putative phosphoribosyl transferase